MGMIEVNHLRKDFMVFQRPRGAVTAVRSLFVRKCESIA